MNTIQKPFGAPIHKYIEYKNINDCPKELRYEYLRRQYLSALSRNPPIEKVCTETHILTCDFCSAEVKVLVTQKSLCHTNGTITHPGEVV